MNKLKNFLNVRVQGVNHSKILDRVKHNIRHVRARTSENNNTNILIDINSDVQYNFMSSKNGLSHLMYKDIASRYKADRIEHNEVYKQQNKRSLRNSQGSWAEGVLTFSEALKNDLGTKYSEKDLIDCAKSMLKEFEEKWKTKIDNVVLHRDESNFHFHFIFKNFDEHGASITHKNRDKETLSNLQDLMFQHFEKLGMKRGIKKETSEFDYKKVRTDLKSDISELENKQKKLVNNINKLKELRKKTSIETVQLNNDKKAIYKNISDEQKALRNEYKILQEKKQELIKKSKEVSEQEILLRDAVYSYKNTISSMPKDTQQVIATIQQLSTKLEDYNSFMTANKDIDNKFKIHEQKEKVKKLERIEHKAKLMQRVKEHKANRKIKSDDSINHDIDFLDD